MCVTFTAIHTLHSSKPLYVCHYLGLRQSELCPWRQEGSVSNRFMAACEQVSSQTILHVKTGIHTLHHHTVYHVETPLCLCFFQLVYSSSSTYWHELNTHKSKRDTLGAVKRISHKVCNLNVSDCCWVQDTGVLNSLLWFWSNSSVGISHTSGFEWIFWAVRGSW